MSLVLGDNVSDHARRKLDQTASEIATTIAADHFEGDVPGELIAYWEVQARAAMVRALDALTVPTPDEWQEARAGV